MSFFSPHLRILTTLAAAIVAAGLAVSCASDRGGDRNSAADREEEAEEAEVKDNVLEEYINTPKDKARAARDRLEGAQRRAADQLDSLQDE